MKERKLAVRRQRAVALPTPRARQLEELALHYEMGMSDLVDGWIQSAWKTLHPEPNIPGFVLKRGSRGGSTVVEFGIANGEVVLLPFATARRLGAALAQQATGNGERILTFNANQGGWVTCFRQGRGFLLTIGNSGSAGTKGNSSSTGLTASLLADIGECLDRITRESPGKTKKKES